MDQLALKEAHQLSFRYSWGPPPAEAEYWAVQVDLWKSFEENEARRQSGIEAEEEDDDRKLPFVHGLIENDSKDLAFNELSLWLLEEDLEVTAISLADRVFPPTRRSGEHIEGSPSAWIWRENYEDLFPPGTNQWSLGSIKASSRLLEKIEFATPQFYEEWNPIHL